MEKKRDMKAKSFIFTIVLGIVLSISLVACGKDDKNTASSADLSEGQNTAQEEETVNDTSSKEAVSENENIKKDELSDDSADEANVADKAEYKGKISKDDEASNDPIEIEGMFVTLADGRLTDLSDYEEVDVSTGEYKTGLLFIVTTDYVSDFKLYELKMVDTNSEGKPVYNRNRVYYQDTVGMEMPLVLNVEFPGDMSAYAVSYIMNNVGYDYSIRMSGKDGSLIVEELDLGYPDDSISIPFSLESQFHFEDYEDLALKGSMDETNIDQIAEGVSDMLINYQGEYDGTEYESAYGVSLSQEFYNDSEYGTTVAHTIIWTGNELVDKVMQKVGYKEYEVNYFYPFGIWIGDNENVAPVYVSLLVDGVGFEYYFADNELVRRADPENVTNNPKTNDFLNSLYKIGCYYGNTLEGERNRYNIAVNSLECIEKKGDTFILRGEPLGRLNNATFVIDENTVFDKDFEKDILTGLEDEESFYDWYCRAYEAVENGEDWIELTALLGIWDVRTTNGHIDSICGTYWWD